MKILIDTAENGPFKVGLRTGKRSRYERGIIDAHAQEDPVLWPSAAKDLVRKRNKPGQPHRMHILDKMNRAFNLLK